MISSLKFQRLWAIIFLLLFSTFPAAAQTFGERAGVFLTTPGVTGVLLTVGFLFWFLSIVTMGTGVAEVCCFVTFSLIFGGRFLTGEDPWIPLALFVVGAAFALIEVFVMPGLGVFGVLSLLSFAGLSVLLMESPQSGLMIFCLSILLSMVSGALVMKFLPNFFVTRKFLVLEAPKAESTAVSKPAGPMVAVGDVGKAASTLRPVGMAMFGTQRVEVISEGEFLKKGEPVEVVRVEAQKVVVRACQS